jgi:hypothetical protein
MNSPNPDFRSTPPVLHEGRAAQHVVKGDDRGENVSPVPSDATGVRQGGARGRVDATRSRRRYLTH